MFANKFPVLCGALLRKLISMTHILKKEIGLSRYSLQLVLLFHFRVAPNITPPYNAS